MPKKWLKAEFGIIIGLLILGFFWAFIMVPYLTSQTWFLTLHPLFAYILYNIGWILLITVIFGGLVSVAIYKKNRLLNMVKWGSVSWICFSLVGDLWQPPLFLSPSGQVLIPLGGQNLESVAVDAMAATLWQQFFALFGVKLQGSWLWFFFTYVVTSIIGILLMALILTPKQFVKLFSDYLGRK
jgi:hypothetical protein